MSAETVGNGVVVASGVGLEPTPETDAEDVANSAPAEQAVAETPEWANDPATALKMVEDLRKENAKFRTRAKEFADDAAYDEAKKALETVKEQKLASMSEVERVQAEAKEHAERAESLALELNRERAARKHGLPEDLMEFLTGSDADEIEAKAVRLAEFAAAKPGAPLGTPDKSQGMRDAGLPTKEQAIRNLFDFS